MILHHTIASRTFNISLRWYLAATVAVLACTLSGVIFWMVMAPLSAASIASGKLVTQLEKQSIQHHVGGVVDNLLVKEGDIVQHGQVLLILSDPLLASQLLQVKQKLFIKRAQMQRIEAEINGQTPDWTKNEDGSLDLSQQQILTDQQALWRQNQQIHQNQIDSLDQQISQAINEQDSYKAWLKSEQQSLSLLDEEIDANNQLFEKGFISKISFMDLQRSRSTLSAKVSEHQTNINRAKNRTNELNSNLTALKRSFVQRAQEEKQELIVEIQSLEQQLNAALQLNDRIEVKAPVSGEVINLAIHTQGGVIAPGGVIMDIVPTDSPVIASINIAPRDIDVVHEGLIANVRLSSYSYRKSPSIKGELFHISADSIIDKKSGSEIYQGKILLNEDELLAAGMELKPGMPVEAQIVLQKRSVFDYLLSPLLESMEKGMREI